MRGEQRNHAEGAGDVGDPLAENTLADDAEPGALKVVDRVVEEAELAGPLPFAVQHILPERHDVAAQRQHQGEGVFRHRVDGIAADVAHRDAVRPAILLVDAIGAGGGDGDQLQLRQPFQKFGGQLHLVDDGDLGTGQTLQHLIRQRPGMFDQLMREARPA